MVDFGFLDVGFAPLSNIIKDIVSSDVKMTIMAEVGYMVEKGYAGHDFIFLHPIDHLDEVLNYFD